MDRRVICYMVLTFFIMGLMGFQAVYSQITTTTITNEEITVYNLDVTNGTLIEGNLTALGDVIIGGTLYGGSPLKINQEVIIETNTGQTLLPSQLLVKNNNNGTLSSSNVIVENDIGIRFGLGLGSSQGEFAEGVNQASLFYIGDNVMLFSIVSNEDRGWVWKHADISQFPNITSTYQMFLSPEGNLNVSGALTVNDKIGMANGTIQILANEYNGRLYIHYENTTDMILTEYEYDALIGALEDLEESIELENEELWTKIEELEQRIEALENP